MPKKKKREILFADYYDEWIEIYKSGAIADVTLEKYYNTARHIRAIAPKLFVSDLDRLAYQKIINTYAKTHEKATTKDFHTQVKACVRDMFHDRMIDNDPTYRVVIKGKVPTKKNKKFLQKEELSKLLRSLDISDLGRDWFILLIAKTGMRYAEALALTPADFDWTKNTMTINKTWDYRYNKGFKPTKTPSSIRTIGVDWQVVGQFKPLIQDLPENDPIFIEKDENGNLKRPFNSTINSFLKVRCKELNIPVITLHALRHTHASILLAEGVSIHTISKRLGHSNVGVTQETYAHVLDELQKKDDEKMMTVLMQIA